MMHILIKVQWVFGSLHSSSAKHAKHLYLQGNTQFNLNTEIGTKVLTALFKEKRCDGMWIITHHPGNQEHRGEASSGHTSPYTALSQVRPRSFGPEHHILLSDVFVDAFWCFWILMFYLKCIFRLSFSFWVWLFLPFIATLYTSLTEVSLCLGGYLFIFTRLHNTQQRHIRKLSSLTYSEIRKKTSTAWTNCFHFHK